MKLREYLTEGDHLLFDKDNVKQIKDEIVRNIDAPVVGGNVSKLGGTPTIFIEVSLDPKDTWPNNIFENSRYLRFSIEPDPKQSNIELFTKSHKIFKKFRKQKGKTIKEIINKINKYINSID